MEKYLSLLSQSDLFRGMSPEDILKMCSCLGCTVAEYRAETPIWLAGYPVERAGIVLEGRVRAEYTTYGGQQVVVAQQTAGRLFGDVLMSSENGESPVDILAAEDSVILFVPFARIMAACPQGNCCQCHDTLRTNLLREISAKFWALQKKIRYLSAESLRGKIALYLLDNTDGGRVPLFDSRCSRDELASLLGVNRSALSRELGRLQQEGVISFFRSSFRLENPAALTAMCQ